MASQRRTVSNAKSGKVVQRLKQRIEEGKFYEAHQTYKVLYQRYCAQGKTETAKDLLFEGASTLLRHSQVNGNAHRLTTKLLGNVCHYN